MPKAREHEEFFRVIERCKPKKSSLNNTFGALSCIPYYYAYIVVNIAGIAANIA